MPGAGRRTYRLLASSAAGSDDPQSSAAVAPDPKADDGSRLSDDWSECVPGTEASRRAGPSISAASHQSGRWICSLATALVGIYVGSYITLWGNLYFRDRWDQSFQSHGKAHEFLGFWFLWDNLGNVIWPDILHHLIDYNYSGRYEKDTAVLLPGLLLITTCSVLLVVSAERLAKLRDARIGRHLQTPYRCGRFGVAIPGRLLVNVVAGLVLCYWVTPSERCRAEAGYRCHGPAPEVSDGTQFNCTCTRWPAPLGFDHPGVNSLRSFGYRLGSVAGWCLAVALVPIPKHSPVVRLFGLSFEKGVRIHRVAGIAAVVFAVLHTLFVIVEWERQPIALKMWEQGYWFRYTLAQLTPWCIAGVVNHDGPVWPWDELTGQWLKYATPGQGSLYGWGVPMMGSQWHANHSMLYPVNMSWLYETGQCPWLFDTVHFEYQYGCQDGTRCFGSACCASHGGRRLCPATSPNMCASTNCVDANDFKLDPRRQDLSGAEHCCASDDCSDQGGLRQCVVKIDSHRHVEVPARLRFGGLGRSGCPQPTHPNILWKIGFHGSSWATQNFFVLSMKRTDIVDVIMLQNCGTGMVATVMFILLWLGSLETVRRNYFKAFHRFHIVVSLIAFCSLPFHFAYGGLDDASVVLVVMLLDYIWRSFLVRSADTIVEDVEVVRMGKGRGDLLRLVLSHKTQRVTEPGQYCFLRIWQLGWFQWHPFSIASTPSFSKHHEGKFVVYIKDSGTGNWTTELLQNAPKLLRPQRRGTAKVRVSCDGMYGRITVPLDLYRSVFITCGGIGCTPMFSVLMHLAEKRAEERPHVCFVWAVRDPELIQCFQLELTRASQLGWDVRVHLTSIFAMNSPNLDSDGVERGASDDEMDPFISQNFDTKPQRVDAGKTGARGETDPLQMGARLVNRQYERIRHGRPHVPQIMHELQSRFMTTGAAATDTQRCAVLTCGPSSLVHQTRAACADSTGPMLFEFHSEVFEW